MVGITVWLFSLIICIDLFIWISNSYLLRNHDYWFLNDPNCDSLKTIDKWAHLISSGWFKETPSKLVINI